MFQFTRKAVMFEKGDHLERETFCHHNFFGKSNHFAKINFYYTFKNLKKKISLFHNASLIYWAINFFSILISYMHQDYSNFVLNGTPYFSIINKNTYKSEN